jgi:hypothetical protein
MKDGCDEKAAGGRKSSAHCGCCDPGECCPTDPASGAGRSGGPGWRTVVFVAIVLLAAFVAAHALLANRAPKADSPSGSEAGAAARSAVAMLRGESSLEGIQAAVADYPFVFPVMPRAGDEADARIVELVRVGAGLWFLATSRENV